MRGKAEGGGGTRVEGGEVGGGQRGGGGQLRPRVEAEEGRGAGRVPQRGGSRDPGTENISKYYTIPSSLHCLVLHSINHPPAQSLQLSR